MKVIEETDQDTWGERERYWIEYYKDSGSKLTNTAKGGNGGGSKHTKKARQKISRAKKGMKFTESHKEKLRQVKNDFFKSKKGKELASKYSRKYAKLTDEEVKQIYLLAHQQGISNQQVADQFNTTVSTVSEIKHNKRYKHVKRPNLPLLD